jgi:hypothetical protein
MVIPYCKLEEYMYFNSAAPCYFHLFVSVL